MSYKLELVVPLYRLTNRRAGRDKNGREGVSTVETTTFHRRHPITRYAVLLLGALVLWVGSAEVTAARPQARRPRLSIQSRQAKKPAAVSRRSAHRRARSGGWRR